MPNIKLVKPTMDMMAEAIQFKQAFYDAGERTIYGSYKLDQDRYSYEQWLEILDMNLSTETANPRFGTSETYFAQNTHGEIVGICNLRHTLTRFYQDSGHIGISVHPNSRQKGYGKEILLLLLEQARVIGMSEVKLVCSRDNEASRRTILVCGGKLVRRFYEVKIEKDEFIISL